MHRVWLRKVCAVAALGLLAGSRAAAAAPVGAEARNAKAPAASRAGARPRSAAPPPVIAAAPSPVTAAPSPAPLPTGVRYAFIPLVSFAKETGVLFAPAAMISRLPTRPNGKVSSVFVALAATTRSQLAFQAKGDWYLDNDRYLLTGEGVVALYPSSYFGIGNDNPKSGPSGQGERYTPSWMWLFGSPMVRVREHLYAGPSFDLRRLGLEEYDPNGRLATEAPTGWNGANVVGLGAALLWDSRDSSVAPLRGSRLETFTRVYEPSFGSSQRFTFHRFDARTFFPIAGVHTLALRALLDAMGGDPPLGILPILGGRLVQRGHFDSRYVDRTRFALQAELRSAPLWWRLGLTAFADLGQVAPDPGKLGLARAHLSGGGGLRILLSEDSRAYFRFDVAKSADDAGFNVYVGEPW